MSNDKTVVLSRATHVLWVYCGNVTDGLYYNVTGVVRLQSYSDLYPIAVLQEGRTIGIEWNITEIREVW